MDQSMELGYLGVEVSSPDEFGKYVNSILGLQPGDRTVDGAPTWRMDTKAHRLIVHQGDADDAAYVGFVAVDNAAFDLACDRLRASGAEVVEGAEAEKAVRRVDRLVHTTAPWGTRVELASGLADAATPFESSLVPGGFVTASMGVGHVVFLVPGGHEEFEAADRFVIDALGMVLSDVMETDIQGMAVVGNFYHCNSRHHSLALVQLPFPVPKKLDHIMIETVSEDNVGHAYDRALAAKVPISRHLGKHPNDRMFSFYSVTPAGFQMEFGAGAVQVDDNWEVVTYDRVSAWGHHSS
ncbi:VOC family protein [Nocardia sp. CA-120079]|uniref:VOC family protein n=1 Tax=Nocardia sp. CA-120079 TaxID=3239974 RepID=UPI003D98419F